MPDRADIEAIGSLALTLLRQDFPDADDQLTEVRWAESEFDRMGLWPIGHMRGDNPASILFNLIEENPLLPDWMRARSVSVEQVLEVEEFRELIDRLTPSFRDG